MFLSIFFIYKRNPIIKIRRYLDYILNKKLKFIYTTLELIHLKNSILIVIICQVLK